MGDASDGVVGRVVTGKLSPFRLQVVEQLLKDSNTMVLGSAVAAFTEVRVAL